MKPDNSIQVRAVTDDGVVLAGYAVVFGGKDAYDTYFDASTDFMLDQYPTPPLMFNHAIDVVEDLDKPIGVVRKLTKDEWGVWVEAELKKHERYLNDDAIQALMQLAEARALGWSSGSISHLVRSGGVNEYGARHLARWPIAEVSLTVEPAEPRTIGVERIRHLLKTPPPSPVVEPEAVPEAETQATAALDNTADTSAVLSMETNIMTDTQAVQAAPEQTAPADLDTRIEQAVKAALENAPALRTMPVNVPTPDAEKDSESVRTFNIHVRTGAPYRVALNEGTAGQGGFLVPTLYSNELVQRLRDLSYLRQAGARILSVNGTNSFKVPAMTDSGAAVLTAEGGLFDQKEPTFTEITFTPYKYTKLSQASDEVLADSRIDVVSQVLMPDAVQAFAAAENAAFTTGTGSAQPEGVVTGASLGKTAASATAITADEVIDLFFALDYKYRANASWMMNDATLALLRKLKDTTNQYLIQPGLNGSPLPTMMGRPVITNNSMATPAAAARTILFGDFSYYWIADFAGLEMMRLNELYAANGRVGFRWFKRFDGHVMLSEAIKYLRQL